MQAQCHAGEAKSYEQVIRNFLAQPAEGGDAVYAVPPQWESVHHSACNTISAATTIVHLLARGTTIMLASTQINVYFVWLAWMQAMHSATLDPLHPKAMDAEYFRSMTPEKMVVLVPVVCLWVSVKSTETWSLRYKDVLRIIDRVQRVRNCRVDITLQDVVHAERLLLLLIDFDVMKSQTLIDGIEDIMGQHLENQTKMDAILDHSNFEDAQVRSFFRIFN